MVTVTAIKHFQHAGATAQPGDVLEVRAVDAASLKYRGLARLGGERVAEPVAPVPKTSEPDSAPRRRRAYRRRDMAATALTTDLTAEE